MRLNRGMDSAADTSLSGRELRAKKLHLGFAKMSYRLCHDNDRATLQRFA